MAGVAGPGVTLIYAYFTQDAGMWKKHGLDVRVVLLNPVERLPRLRETGEVKFAINSGPGTIAARTQGADAVIIAAVVNTLPYSLVAANGITKWQISRERKSASAVLGQEPTLPFRLVCKKFGLDPIKDIIILQGGTQPSRLQACRCALDATLVSPPLDLTAKKQGFSVFGKRRGAGYSLSPARDRNSDRFNRENPQTVKNFLKGFIEGVHYVATHKGETKKIITKYKDLRPGDLEATYQSFLQVTDYSANPNLEGIRNAIDEVRNASRRRTARNRKTSSICAFSRNLQRENFSSSLKIE